VNERSKARGVVGVMFPMIYRMSADTDNLSITVPLYSASGQQQQPTAVAFSA